MAGSTLMALPVVVFLLIVQRKVTAGMTAGAVEGVRAMSSIVGVDVGGTSTRSVCFDDGLRRREQTRSVRRRAGRVDDRRSRQPSRRRGGGRTWRGGHRRCRGGSTSPGGIVSSARNLGIAGPAPIGDLVAAGVGAPGARAERRQRRRPRHARTTAACRRRSRWPTSTSGTGIAAGFVLAGRLWRGATGAAGEIGHVPMRSHGPACRCGQSGCAEAVGSGRAVADDPARGETS